MQKTLLSLLVGGTLLAQSALGTDATVEATKKTQGLDFFKNAYGSMNISHYQYRKIDAGGNDRGSPAHVRAEIGIGTTLFNDKLDASFYVYGRKYSHTNYLTVRDQPAIYLSWSLFSNDFLTITPYFSYYFKHQDMEANSDLGNAISLKKGFETSVGKVTLANNFYSEVYIEESKKTKSPVEGVDEKNKGFFLADTNNSYENNAAETRTEHLSFSLLNFTSVTFAPSAVKGLSFRLQARLDRDFTPKYVYDEDENDKVKFDGYRGDWSVNRLGLKSAYAINDMTTVSNTVQWYKSDMFTKNEGPSNIRLRNIFGVSHKLF